MQSWQLVPILILAGVGAYVFLTRGKMRQAATQMYTEAMAGLRAQCAAERRAGESEPALVIALTRSFFKAKVFYVALTDQRLFLQEPPGAVRTFPRDATLKLAIKKKQFADVGNMQTTYSSGWEARVTLPGGEEHVWRLYDEWTGYADQARNLDAFLRTAPEC